MSVDSSNVLSEWEDIIDEVEDYTRNSNYTRLSSYSNISAVLFSQVFIVENCNRYACAVVAMLAVCAQEGYYQLRNVDGTYNLAALRQAFNLLWTLSCTTVYKTEGSTQYGSTYDNQIARTIEDFCLYMTNNAIDVGYIDNPTWTQIITHVGQGESAIFATSIYLNENGTVREAGHAVNLVGYATYRDNSTGNTLKFLTIGDGWYNRFRYMKFDNSMFHDSYLAYIP